MAEAKVAETDVEAPPKKRRGKQIYFIAIGILVLALIGGAAFFLMKKPAVDNIGEGEDSPREAKAKKSDKKSDNAAPSFYKFDKAFTVKLQTEQQEAYLQTEIQLRVLDTATLEFLKQYDPELKHRIMLILLTKKASELDSAQGVQRLSNEIREIANNTLEPPAPKKRREEAKEPADIAAPDAPVQAVLFTSFIIQ